MELVRRSYSSGFLVADTRLYTLPCRSVGRLVRWSVRPSVTLSFFGVYGRFWGYCPCPTAWLVNFITAPAHPHATGAAVYTALLYSKPLLLNRYYIVNILMDKCLLALQLTCRYRKTLQKKSPACQYGVENRINSAKT